MNVKFDVVKVVGIAGMVLGMIATVASSWSQDKKMEETVNKKIEEALANR